MELNQLIKKAFSATSTSLSNIYNQRKRTLFFQRLVWIITGLFFAFALLNMLSYYLPFLKLDALKVFQATPSNPYATVYPIIILMILLYPSTFYFTKAFQKFKIEEANTIAKMVNMLFPRVDFAQNVKAPVREVIKSKLFAWVKENTPIYSYGQIRNKVNNTEINITDIGIVEENVSNKLMSVLMRIPILNMFAIGYQYVYKNTISNTLADNTHYTYRGMFCWLNFKKQLNGHTVILPKSQSAEFDRLASFSFKEEQKVNLEDPRFTNQFIVYSTDQVEARYVLSMAFMEKIIALKEKFDQSILLSFQNQQMYLAVKNKHGLFSFPSGKLDKKTVEELAEDINTALEIAADWK